MMPRPRSWHACGLALGLSLASATTARAQETAPSAPALSVRQLRIDPLLLASSLDSARLREAVTEVVRSARRLVHDTTTAPALDVDIAVVRTASEPLPQALVRVEVGRNRMERGAATRLAWERSVTTGEYRTFRALAAAMPARVLELVQDYLAGRR